MTVARVSQVVVEVVRTNTGDVARVSQVAVEVIRLYQDTLIRTSQIAVEVLRPNVANASTSSPTMMCCT